MNRSLYSKLVLIMLLLIASLMLVVGAFLIRGVRSFYQKEFYEQMHNVFSVNTELVDDLRSAAGEEDGAQRIAEMLAAFSGQLGIDAGRRNYYVLDIHTGEKLIGSGDPDTELEITPNILTAISGREGYASETNADYMDVALPIEKDGSGYIVYIRDNKATVQSLSDQIFGIILEALAVGLAISVLLSLFLAKTMVTPLQGLTQAAERVASGDFSQKPQSEARDEIGVLTRTFNDMAGQLENTLDDLRKSEQMRREFVANVSHELRTPITSIRSYAETLQDSCGSIPQETEQNFLRVILGESDRMTAIVSDLLTLSRFDAGSYTFRFERFSFEQSVRDVYNATLLEAQKHHHSFTLEISSGMPEIRGDRERIEQVLINMISNAIKYTHDGGRIEVTASHGDGFVSASVQDNGIGIPKEDVPHVFERFYRVDKARSRESGGTGLGLSIAQEIVARHDGRLSLKSRQGKGTTITVELPVEGPKDA